LRLALPLVGRGLREQAGHVIWRCCQPNAKHQPQSDWPQLNSDQSDNEKLSPQDVKLLVGLHWRLFPWAKGSRYAPSLATEQVEQTKYILQLDVLPPEGLEHRLAAA